MKNLLIVGASKGIGLSIARSSVFTHQLNTVSREMSPELDELKSTHFSADVIRPDTPWSDFMPESLKGLVYCPGSINLKPFHRFGRDEFERDFSVNVLGAIACLQAALPALKAAKGASVVLFSTVAVSTGMGFHASIAASKGAIEGLARSLAAEWAPYQIRVNVIAPSLTDTPLAASLLNTPEKREASAKRHPLNRIGNPDQIAALATFLLSDEAQFITGQVIGADGGLGRLRV